MKQKPILIAIIIIISIVILFYVYNLEEQSNPSDEYIFSAQEFSEKIEAKYDDSNKTAFINFKPLNHGDRVIIKDTIDFIRFQENLNYTAIEFNVDTIFSTGEPVRSIEFDFKGNLTDIYKKNDDVQIRFTIKHVTFTSEGWTYDCEVYAEGWDQDYYVSNQSCSQVLPQACIVGI